MLRSGLVSITFRKLSPAEIVRLVGQAGLDAVEWGGDVHVPHGDVARARDVRRMTEEAGLTVASYGSYYRVAGTTEFTIAEVVDTAAALGAPTLRVWAGDCGSADADAEHRALVIKDSRRLAEEAARAGIRVAYEFHRNTLTDTTESTLALLEAVAHPNIGTYWQPPRELSDTELHDSLIRVIPYLTNLHVFHWGPAGERFPLAEGRERWASLLRLLGPGDTESRFAMIEFVQGDAPGAFLSDAEALLAILREAGG